MGDLAIKIGASSQVYNDLALAYGMRGKQKLTITGSGVDIKAALTSGDLSTYADGIGAIKSTSDIIVTTADVTGNSGGNKAALLKLGTRSLVLNGSGANGAASAAEFAAAFKELDATYTKFKSMNIAAAPTIAATDLQSAINFSGMEILSGKTFKVTGTAADIKTSMASLLRNVARIDSITLTGGSDAEFSLSQLQTLGDKLVKSGGTKVVLKDSADNLLQTSGIATVNKYNNTNLNISTTATANTVNLNSTTLTSNAHSLATGDQVTYQAGGTAASGLTNGSSYYVRNLTSSTFELYATKDQAVDPSAATTGRITVGATANTGNASDKFVPSPGTQPVRVTTLDKVAVTGSTLAQLDQLTTLTTANTGAVTGNTQNRKMSDIISDVQLKDTQIKLAEGAKTVTFNANTGLDLANDIITTSSAHNLVTGDMVDYDVGVGGTGITNTTLQATGQNYFVIRDSATTIKLASSRADALAGTAINITAIGSGTQTFFSSKLQNSMGAASGYNGGTGSVSRVTINGEDGSVITSTTLESIATKAKMANSGANVTYSAKAIDIQKNAQALTDNAGLATGKKLTEIVVSDGSVASKKSISLSMDKYAALRSLFRAGVINPVGGGNNTPSNYAFTVTGASYLDSTKSGDITANTNTTNLDGGTGNTLQDDKNVSSFFVTNLAKTDITSLNALRDFLSQSKLKTATTTSPSGTTWSDLQKSNLTSYLSNISSGVDKAKLKTIV
jgi:hypothetical protein